MCYNAHVCVASASGHKPVLPLCRGVGGGGGRGGLLINGYILSSDSVVVRLTVTYSTLKFDLELTV